MKQILLLLVIMTFSRGQSLSATMTLYKDGWALVKQPVEWEVQEGFSTLSYEHLPEGLVPDSPYLLVQGTQVHFQRYEGDVFTGERFFQDHKGEKVIVKIMGGKTEEGKLLEITPAMITLQKRSTFKSIARDRIDYISLRSSDEEPSLSPTLAWDVSSPTKGKAVGELVYQSRGFEWNGIYRMILKDGKNVATFIPEAFMTNNSRTDFSNVKIKLVEGTLHRIKRIPVSRTRMRGESPRADMLALGESQTPAREVLGDYHIYSLPKRMSFKGNESITVRLYDPREITFVKTYLFENTERSQRDEPLVVEYQIDNTEKNNLNIPLPAGKIELYQSTSQGSPEFLGEDQLQQVPRGESVAIIAGRAFDVVGKRKVLNYDRQRKSEEAVIEVQITNTRKEKVQVRLIEHINGDWVIRQASHNYLKEDASTIHIPLTVRGNRSEVVTYTYRKEWK